MIMPAFFVASMVGLHVELIQSTYSSKCPHSIAISCTRVTGPSVYWRSSLAAAFWVRASRGSARRNRNTTRARSIFYSPFEVDIHPDEASLRFLFEPSATALYLSTSIGETRVARLAGIKQAAIVTIPSSTGTTANVIGSLADTPNRRLDIS